MVNMELKETKEIGQARYAIIDSGIFGFRLVAGIVTGVRYTEKEPQYEISFGKNSWWSSKITDKIEDIGTLFELASLERIKETHGLNIKYGH